MANYDSNYEIAQEISARIGTSPIPFDSVYSIAQEIYNELGGEPAQFDSVYSILLGILPLVEGGIASKVIDDNVITTNKTWSSSKINSELSSIIGDANSEIVASETVDVTFVNAVPTGEGAEGEYKIYVTEQADTLYMYENGAWTVQTIDANKLYFDTENDLLYTYKTATQKFVEVGLDNTIIFSGSITGTAAKTALNPIKTPGVYNVLQHQTTSGKTKMTNWVMTVTMLDSDEADEVDGSVYQKLENNYTIYKRYYKPTTDTWTSMSKYYEGLVRDSLTSSAYYSWSVNKIKSEIEAHSGATYTAGQNISIDANNAISADGYIFDSSNYSFATKYRDDEDPNIIGTNIATGNESHAEGWATQAIGDYGSHAEGTQTQANGAASHAEGNQTVATGNFSHAEGGASQATGNGSHAEGQRTVASGKNSHAEGTTSKNQNPTTASGSGSHAEGASTLASGNHSHAEGELTEAKNPVEHAQGNCNLSHKNSDTYGDAGNTIDSIGIGHTLNYVPQRKNATEVMQNGDMYLFGVGRYQGTDTKVQDATVQTLQDVINGKANVADLNSYATIAYVTGELAGKQDILTEGAHIDITNNVISVEYEVATTADIEALFAEPVPPTPGPANDEIWYTTSDGEIILIGGGSGSGSGSGSGGGWPQVLSNTYEDGKGVIKFAENLTEIPDGGFYDNMSGQYNNLTSVTIPNSVTRIGSEAFQECIGLTSVTIPNSVTSIGDSAFYHCDSLTSVTIPNSVPTIGHSTFQDCDNLTSVTIGNSVTSIEGYAFYNCCSLTNITFNGTMSEWNNIELGYDWRTTDDYYIPATAVHCTDGDVILPE